MTIEHVGVHVFDPNGAVDAAASSKSGGIVIADADNHSQALSFGPRLADASAVIYGWMRRSGAPYPFVARIKNGALDPSFGVGGVRRIETYYAVIGALQEIRSASGAITGYYVGVNASAVGNLSPVGERAAEYRIYKVSPAGVLDPSFGSGGNVKVDGSLLSVDASGRFIVSRAYNPASPTANFDYTQFIMQRYTSSCALDTTYGTGGTATATIPKSHVNDVLVLKNGEMLLALGVANSATEFGDADRAALSRRRPDRRRRRQALRRSHRSVRDALRRARRREDHRRLVRAGPATASSSGICRTSRSTRRSRRPASSPPRLPSSCASPRRRPRAH